MCLFFSAQQFEFFINAVFLKQSKESKIILFIRYGNIHDHFEVNFDLKIFKLVEVSGLSIRTMYFPTSPIVLSDYWTCDRRKHGIRT